MSIRIFDIAGPEELSDTCTIGQTFAATFIPFQNNTLTFRKTNAGPTMTQNNIFSFYLNVT